MAEFRQYSTKNKVTTQANFDSLDKSTLSIGEQYSIVGPLEKDDLSTDIQNSLTKADNAFVAPTNDSTATAGQVLTKTAEGSEWKDAVSGDVTAAGNNTFTGTNTFNGTLTAKSGATVPGSGMDKTVYKHHQIAITNPSLGTATYNFGITSGFTGTVATKEHDCFTYIEKTAGPVSSGVILSFTANESTQIYNNFERTILKVLVSEVGATPVIHLYPYGFNATSSTQKYCIFVSPVYNDYQYVLTMSITSGQTFNGSLSRVAIGGSGDVTAAGNNTFTGENTFNAQTVFNAELAVNTEQRSASYRGGKITADGYDLGFPQKSGILGVAEDGIIVIEKTITAFPTATSPSISIPFTTNEQNTIKNSIERIILKISTSNTYRILYPCMGSTILWDFATGIDSNVYYTLALTGGTGVFTYNHKMTVPVGNIYLSTSSTSPAGTFGGTWERIKDKFLLAAGDTYSAGATGGSADAVVVSHKHNGITWNDETPLTLDNNSSTTGNTYRIAYGRTSKTQAAINTPSVGVSGTGKNMPPYIAVYVWKRVS